MTAMHINWQLAVQAFVFTVFGLWTIRLWRAGLPYLRAACLCLTASSAIWVLTLLMPDRWRSDWLSYVLFVAQPVVIVGAVVFLVVASLRGEMRKIPTLRPPVKRPPPE